MGIGVWELVIFCLQFYLTHLKYYTYEKITIMILIHLILSLWSWGCFLVFTTLYNLIGILFCLPFSFFFKDGRPRIFHWIAVHWAKAILASSPFWSLTVEGQNNIQPGKHYVIISNHQSMLDIFAALGGLPIPFKFMAKKELFPIPFIGWHMALAGYIPIQRSSPQSGKEALAAAKKWLHKGMSVLFFPEGTRSLDGKIGNFKSGAFRAAEECGIEILPCVMVGTGEALPKKSLIMKKMITMKVSIGKPVSPNDPEKIRQEMMERLAALKKPNGV